MNNQKGIVDLMEAKRFRPKHIAEELIKHNVPGKWNIYQNIYNLINGRVIPKDAYIYILFSNLLEVELKTILYRYSDVRVNNLMHEDLEW
jgi:hypothetical protein